MGLAISIIASTDVQEKVWYHQCGSKGRNCENRKLTSQGGCTIWYDEAEYLGAIEERLSDKIAEVGPAPSFALPAEILRQAVVYGEAAAAETYVPSLHFDQIAPKVRQLAEMEFTAQNKFLELQMHFS